MVEVWKEVFFNGEYTKRKISNQGRLLGDNGVLFSPLDNGAGYLTYAVYSWKDESGTWRSKREYVHRLVAQHFIPNPMNLPQVNHKDCDKSNNNVENLEWIKRSDNINHAHKMGRMKKRTDDTEVEVLKVSEVIDLYTSVKRDGVGISEKARQMRLPRTTASSIMNKRSRGTITDRIDRYLSGNDVVYGRLPTLEELGFTDKSQLIRVHTLLPSHNVSGVLGVCRTKVEGIPFWMAFWNESDKKKTKYFNCERMGDAVAFKAACDYRAMKMFEINGAETH